MKFTIITPSYNQLDYLRRCVASVADQVGSRSEQMSAVSSQQSATQSSDLRSLSSGNGSSIHVHHHIQDGGSTDGTVDWLRQYDAEVGGRRTDDRLNAQSLMPRAYSFSLMSERDTGMYDAINEGVLKALKANSQKPSAEGSASIIAWLNCDEQYLPGTLEYVADYFDRHPEVDILFGDYLVVDESGRLLSFRKGYAPRLRYIQVFNLYNLSCAMFFRADVFRALGGFDTQYRAIADEDFVVRALKAGFTAKHTRRYFSTFTFTGENLGGSPVAEEEYSALKQKVPFMSKLFSKPLNVARRIEKFASGSYFQKFPLEYEIYLDDAERRTRLVAAKVGWKWPTVE